jgi:lysophospholipid acyltransferase (LPLAT)-like uncharacterized protein
MAQREPAANVRPASSGVVVPETARWHQRLAAFLIVGAVRMFTATLRYRFVDDGKTFSAESSPAIFCIWHNRLALSMAIYHRYVKDARPSKGLVAMISASKDGSLLAHILEKFAVQPVRGSTSRRGRQALLEATTWVQKGFHAAITPDGPRGPRYQIKEGIVALAQVTGAPIVPVTVWLSRKVCLRSWDGFQIPLPFARCEIRLGAPIRVPREASDAEREALRAELEQAMMAFTKD